jgi:hypothetical protein
MTTSQSYLSEYLDEYEELQQTEAEIEADDQTLLDSLDIKPNDD